MAYKDPEIPWRSMKKFFFINMMLSRIFKMFLKLSTKINHQLKCLKITKKWNKTWMVELKFVESDRLINYIQNDDATPQ